jgi:hypothetical protein
MQQSEIKNCIGSFLIFLVLFASRQKRQEVFINLELEQNQSESSAEKDGEL